MEKTLRTELEQIIMKKDFDIDELKSFETILRKNCSTCLNQFFVSFVSFTAISIIWILVKSSIIRNIKLFNIELSDTKLIIIFLPLIASFILYRSITVLMMHSIIEDLLFETYGKLMPNIDTTRVTYFLSPPSFLIFEAFIRHKIKNKILSKLNQIWTILISLFILIAPTLLIIWMSWYNFKFKEFFPILISVFNIIIVIRVLIIIIIGLKELGHKL